jgi:hypothetical protein
MLKKIEDGSARGSPIHSLRIWKAPKLSLRQHLQAAWKCQHQIEKVDATDIGPHMDRGAARHEGILVTAAAYQTDMANSTRKVPDNYG